MTYERVLPTDTPLANRRAQWQCFPIIIMLKEVIVITLDLFPRPIRGDFRYIYIYYEYIIMAETMYSAMVAIPQ